MTVAGCDTPDRRPSGTTGGGGLVTRAQLFRPGSWRLATRVVSAATVLLAILLAIVVGTHATAVADRRAGEVEQAQEQGVAVAGLLDAFARDLEATVLAVSVFLGGQDGPITQESAGSQLASLRDEYGVLRALFVTDPDGVVIASDSGTGVGFDTSDRPYIIELRGGALTVWSAGLAGVESGETIVSYGRPIHSPTGELRGYTIAAFYPPLLVERSLAYISSQADLTLIDQTGTVLFTASPGVAPAGSSVADSPSVQRALAGESVPVEGRAQFFGGEERFGAVVPVPATGWVVALTWPLAPLEQSLQRDLMAQIAIVTLAVVGVAAVLTLVTYRIIGPLRELSEAAAAVARGERPSIPVVGEAEVRDLAESMGTMAAAVAEREDALRRESARRTMLAEASRAFAEAGLDLEIELGTVAHRMCEFIGDGCVILLKPTDREVLEPAAMHHRVDAAFHRLREAMPASIGGPMDAIAGRVLLTGEAVSISGRSKRDFRKYLEPSLAPYVEEFGPHSLSAQPMNARGRLTGVLVMWRDVSPEPYTPEDEAFLQEVANRAALAIENARLFREASEHAATVDRAMQAQHEFVALASHDLKNPLAAMRATAQWILRELDRGRAVTDERVRQAMETIQASTARAAEEIDEMLEAASLQGGVTLALSPAPLDLVELLGSQCEEFDRVSTHRIVFEATAETCVGSWDAGRLRRAFANLLSNAIKYSPERSEVTVRLECAVEGDSEWVVVSIADEGLGIPPVALSRIFDRFYRADNVVGQFAGNGLGLTGVRQIVDAHAGSIGVRSVLGQGSVFTVRLPRSVRVEAATGPAPASDASSAVSP